MNTEDGQGYMIHSLILISIRVYVCCLDGEYLFVDPENKLGKYAPKGWKSSHASVSFSFFLQFSFVLIYSFVSNHHHHHDIIRYWWRDSANEMRNSSERNGHVLLLSNWLERSPSSFKISVRPCHMCVRVKRVAGQEKATGLLSRSFVILPEGGDRFEENLAIISDQRLWCQPWHLHLFSFILFYFFLAATSYPIGCVMPTARHFDRPNGMRNHLFSFPLLSFFSLWWIKKESPRSSKRFSVVFKEIKEEENEEERKPKKSRERKRRESWNSLWQSSRRRRRRRENRTHKI